MTCRHSRRQTNRQRATHATPLPLKRATRRSALRRLASDTCGYEAPASHARASANAGLDPCVATHLLIANCGAHGLSERRRLRGVSVGHRSRIPEARRSAQHAASLSDGGAGCAPPAAACARSPTVAHNCRIEPQARSWSSPEADRPEIVGVRVAETNADRIMRRQASGRPQLAGVVVVVNTTPRWLSRLISQRSASHVLGCASNAATGTAQMRSSRCAPARVKPTCRSGS